MAGGIMCAAAGETADGLIVTVRQGSGSRGFLERLTGFQTQEKRDHLTGYSLQSDTITGIGYMM